MSNPKRYSFYAVIMHHIDGPDTAEIRFSRENDGMFVQWEDYARLKAEVERLTDCKAEADRLKAEVERLQQEKNELAVMIHPVSLKAWMRTNGRNAAKEGKQS